MKTRLWLNLLFGAITMIALSATPGLPVPGAERLGLSGSAAAQENIDIDTFYDELEPYGQWVWHPRFGYVWLPEDVSPRWRPYTVGHWVSTEEYGWYWESNEPFAWAVYHYGRWGYDPDYGWFWVPGDTWAPAWVQWRYDDQYVGWAPIGPRRPGYAYGVPVSYEPPIAESWVFVQPRYMTSRAISHYAVPITGLGAVFLAATNVYRPQFRGGIVYNYGVPRDYVVRITKRPIYVKKIYKVDSWKGSRYDKNRRGKGITVYAPRVHKDGGRPHRGPKKFVDHPDQFKPKAKLQHTFKGEPPKGFGRSAKDMKAIAKQDPDAFKRKKPGRFDGPGDFDRKGKDRDQDKDQAKGNQFQPGGKDKDRDNDKGQAAKPPFKPGDFNKDRDKDKGQAHKDRDDRDRKGGKGGKDGKDDVGAAPPPKLPPPVVKGGGGDAPSAKTKDTKDFGKGDLRTETERGTVRRDKGNGDRNKNKNKDFGGQGAPNQAKAFDKNGGQGGNRNRNKDRDKGDRGNNKNFGGGGQGGGGGQKAEGNQGGGGGGGKNKKDKCQKHPEKPECR